MFSMTLPSLATIKKKNAFAQDSEPPRPPPIIVRSTTKPTGAHRDRDYNCDDDMEPNPDDTLKIKGHPRAPNEPIFLQLDPPLFIGAVASVPPVVDPSAKFSRGSDRIHLHQLDLNHNQIKLPDQSQNCDQCRHHEGMTLTELLDKFHEQQGIFSTAEVHELLDKAFPPREYIFDGLRWRAEVSKTPTAAVDRLQIFEKFDQESELLMSHCGTGTRNAPRSNAINAVMNELIQELFDECLRQQILDNPQLGVVIMNIRNGLNRILLTLTSLIESAQLKAMRVNTVLGATLTKAQNNLDKEKDEVAKLEKEIRRLGENMKKMRGRHEEEMERIHTKYEEELEFYSQFCSQARRQVQHFEHPGTAVSGKKHSKHSYSDEHGSLSTHGSLGLDVDKSRMGRALQSRKSRKGSSKASHGKKST